MTDKRREELKEKLHDMECASTCFYSEAVRIGVHQFLEHAGFMNEYIKACEKMLEDGIDFTEENVALKSYMAAYVGEKLGCIYGSALEDPENWKAFVAGIRK